jgi:hypothetical protein
MRGLNLEVSILLSVLDYLSRAGTQIKAVDNRPADSAILEKRSRPLKSPLKVKVIEFKVHFERVSSLAKLTLFDQMVLIDLIF